MFANFVRLALLLEFAAWAMLAAWLAGRQGWGALAAATVLGGPAGVRLVLVCGTLLASHAARSARTAEQRLGAWGTLRLVAGEWRAMLANNLAWLPFERLVLRADPPLAPDARIPVILVHGYLSNRGTLFDLARALDGAGVGPVFVPSLPAIFAPIEVFATHLEGVLRAVTSATGQPKAILVCHSMGGLIARCHIARHGTGQVAAVVTLGSPHHGTALAPLGTGSNARQMRRASGFLQGLAQQEAGSGPGCPFLSVYTVHDNLVAPQDSSRLPWARNVAIHGVGHLAMLADRRLHREVFDALAVAGATFRPR